MRGKVFFFTGASFCAIFFLEPSGNLLLEPSGSSWVPPDGSIFVFAIGSPPRMRGKVAAAVPALFLRGITPACAGKSEKQVPFLPPYQDHPRVCGEKARTLIVQDEPQGSPPRMRGKAAFDTGHRQVEGITPAYAGKSSPGSAAGCHARDHPRVCGEKLLLCAQESHHLGSPPRVRGKASTSCCHAGVPGDHPRVCGEKAFGCRRCTFPQGSPPRMRGKGSRMTRATSMVGITPACAGKSARRQAGPPGPAPPPQMRSGWSPPPCTGRQCRTRKSTHARRARIPVPAHTPAPQ